MTESSNDISADIDLVSSEGNWSVYINTTLIILGVVTILQQCDSQIFTGWKQYKVLDTD